MEKKNQPKVVKVYKVKKKNKYVLYYGVQQVERPKQEGRLVLTSLSDNSKKKKMYVYMVKNITNEIIMFVVL